MKVNKKLIVPSLPPNISVDHFHLNVHSSHLCSTLNHSSLKTGTASVYSVCEHAAETKQKTSRHFISREVYSLFFLILLMKIPPAEATLEPLWETDIGAS